VRKPPVLALAAVGGTALGHLASRLPRRRRVGRGGCRNTDAARRAAAAMARPEPRRARIAPRRRMRLARRKQRPSRRLVTRNRQLAETALRQWAPVFIHGDLQVDHVFVDGDEVTGVVDWSEASQGDALFDVAILTLGTRNILATSSPATAPTSTATSSAHGWSLRCLTNVRWLAEHATARPRSSPRSPCCDHSCERPHPGFPRVVERTPGQVLSGTPSASYRSNSANYRPWSHFSSESLRTWPAGVLNAIAPAVLPVKRSTPGRPPDRQASRIRPAP